MAWVPVVNLSPVNIYSHVRFHSYMEPHVPLDGSECLVIIDQTHPLPVCLPGGLQEGEDQMF